MVGVNLIPEPIQFAQARRRHVWRWGAAVAAAAVALAVPLGMDWYQRARADDLRAEHVELEGQLATIRAELRTLTTQFQQASIQLERANALRAKRAWSEMLAMIGRCMPAGCWLTSIATDPAIPAKTGDGPPRQTPRKADSAAPQSPTVVIEAPRMLRLAGYAADAAEPYEFVARLKETGVFSNVVAGQSRSEPALNGTYFRFDLTCEW
jgi:Tfp pilus assembly protein PilN